MHVQSIGQIFFEIFSKEKKVHFHFFLLDQKNCWIVNNLRNCLFFQHKPNAEFFKVCPHQPIYFKYSSPSFYILKHKLSWKVRANRVLYISRNRPWKKEEKSIIFFFFLIINSPSRQLNILALKKTKLKTWRLTGQMFVFEWWRVLQFDANICAGWLLKTVSNRVSSSVTFYLFLYIPPHLPYQIKCLLFLSHL